MALDVTRSVRVTMMCVCVVAISSVARADVQVSTRPYVGGGALLAPQGDEARFDLGLRADALFGPAHVDAFRAGFSLDTRFADFETAEGSLGLTLLAPVFAGFPVTLTASGGYALRSDGQSGPIGVGTFAFGYRAYNYHNAYGYALNAYVSSRLWLDDTDVWEITGGVEIDAEFLFVIPAMFLWNLTFGGD